MNSRKIFAFTCLISLFVAFIAIMTIMILSFTSKKTIENVTTEKTIPNDYSTEMTIPNDYSTEKTTPNDYSTEKTIPNDYSERLIQGVKDGDLLAVTDLLAMTNEYVDEKSDQNE